MCVQGSSPGCAGDPAVNLRNTNKRRGSASPSARAGGAPVRPRGLGEAPLGHALASRAGRIHRRRWRHLHTSISFTKKEKYLIQNSKMITKNRVWFFELKFQHTQVDLWTRIMVMEGRCEVSRRDRNTNAASKGQRDGWDDEHLAGRAEPSSGTAHATTITY